MTLRWRLTLLYTALLSVLLLIVMISVFSIVQQALQRTIVNDLRRALNQVTRSSILIGTQGDPNYSMPSDMAYQVDWYGNITLDSLKAKNINETIPFFPQATPLHIGLYT